jgi:hypothetical protein
MLAKILRRSGLTRRQGYNRRIAETDVSYSPPIGTGELFINTGSYNGGELHASAGFMPCSYRLYELS